LLIKPLRQEPAFTPPKHVLCPAPAAALPSACLAPVRLTTNGVAISTSGNLFRDEKTPIQVPFQAASQPQAVP